MAALLARKAALGKTLTKAEIESSFDGNLCRCTGYTGIVNAIIRTAERRRQRAG